MSIHANDIKCLHGPLKYIILVRDKETDTEVQLHQDHTKRMF
jgi:hypothetical protein